jgi:hypothetical protein
LLPCPEWEERGREKTGNARERQREEKRREGEEEAVESMPAGLEELEYSTGAQCTART